MRSRSTPSPRATPSCGAAALLTALALLVGTAPVARAAPVPARSATADPTAAKAAMDLARYHYGKSDYQTAAKLFHQAYALDAVPEYLFNAARAEQRGFELDDAERDFLAFLDLQDVSDEARHRAGVHLKEVRETRTQLGAAKIKVEAERAKAVAAAEMAEAERAKAAAAAAGASANAVAPVPVVGVNAGGSDGAWRAIAGWSALAVGVGALGYAGWSGLDAASAQKELDRALSATDANGKIAGLGYDDYRARQSGIYDQRDRAVITGSVGLVAAGVGAYLLLTQRAPVRAALIPQRGGALLTLQFGAGGAR